MVSVIKSNSKVSGLVAMLVAVFVGSSMVPVFTRYALESIDPPVIAFLRHGVSGIFLALFALSDLKNHVSPTFLMVSMLLGIGFGVNTLLFSIGIGHTSVVASQMIYTFLPLTVGVASFLFYKQKLSANKIIGIALGLVGIGILFWNAFTSPESSFGSLYGNGIIFIGMLFYTFYLMYSKKNKLKLEARLLATASLLAAGTLLAPLAAVSVSTQPLIIPTPQASLAMVILIVVNMVFFLLLQYAIKRLSSITVAIVTLLAPIMAAIFGWFIFGESLTINLVVSMVIIMLAVLISLFEKKTLFQSLLTKFKL